MARGKSTPATWEQCRWCNRIEFYPGSAKYLNSCTRIFDSEHLTQHFKNYRKSWKGRWDRMSRKDKYKGWAPIKL